MPSYDLLKKKQGELIRKALDGSVFLAPIGAAAIGNLTTRVAPTAGKRVGTAAAVAIVTGGNLVVKVDALADVTVALLATDTPAAVVTKINTAVGATATAALNATILEIASATTGSLSKVQVVSATGTILADTKLTVGTSTGASEVIDLTALPATWDDLGWLTGEGAQFERDVSQSTVTSWGSVTPTRTDVTADVSTLTVVAQETKLLTLEMATGADLSAVAPTIAGGGELKIQKPARPKTRRYRALSLAVDQSDGGDIYIGRFLPRAAVSSFAPQAFGGGDDPITWGVTLTGEEDSTLGYSESWLFGGPGWKSLLVKMGFPAAV